MLEDTVAEKLRFLLDKIYDYRQSQNLILENNPEVQLGDVTSLNITEIKGGKQRNVLPPVVEVSIEFRIALTENPVQFEEMLHKWAKDSGENIEIEFLVKGTQVSPTRVDEKNFYWTALETAAKEMNLKIKPQVFPSKSSAACLREKGIPALGFSPRLNSPILLNDHNDFLDADVYLKEIEICRKILEKIANSCK